MRPHVLAAAAVTLLARPSEAGLRFGCSTLSIQRLDPLVEPGSIPSSHVHQIVGGNAFNATMSGDIGAKGTCTTCPFTEDFSNYWTAVMYFRHENGSYHRVPLYPNAQIGDNTATVAGGMTIYYTQLDFNGNGNQHITAFKPVRCRQERSPRAGWGVTNFRHHGPPEMPDRR